ncbi:hypothetical protein [Sphaerisporangium dianthi]|uniref:Uncharacterized protein n=1 Tax=Sphaerisporangium dianthi TaxID=1436120 RepID=A0ABV9CBB0_9ACTN
MSEDPRRDQAGPVAVPAGRQAYRARQKARRPRRRLADEAQDLRTPSGRTMLPY